MGANKPVKREIAYRRKTSQQRRDELIDAGIVCLGKGGMNAFTIDQICKQAGVSRGLINHHFKTKDELLVSVYSRMTDYLVRDNPAASAHQEINGFIQNSFDETSFNRSNLRAWLAIWGEVATNGELKLLHQNRYGIYCQKISIALEKIADSENLTIQPKRIARQLIALIDGLWLEYCLHSDGFSLAEAKADCYRFLEACGIRFHGVTPQYL